MGEELYRDAIDLILDGIDQTLAPSVEVESDRGSTLIPESWPAHFRNEAERYRPKGQRLLAATQWPAVIDGFRRELSPACALLVTEREFVLIAEEKASPRQHAGDLHHFGGIITYIPIAQLMRLPIEPARTIRCSCFPGACNARRRKTGDHLPRLITKKLYRKS